MIDNNEHDFLYRESSQENKKQIKVERKGGGVKSFLSMITAGMIGSALTLVAIPHMDVLQDLTSTTTEKITEAKTTSTVNKENTETSAVVASTTTASKTAIVGIADMVEESSKAIVGVINLQQQQSNQFSTNTSTVESGSGSGVIFQKNNTDAYIVTNNHVIEGAEAIEVSLHNGKKETAQLVGADALTDLAVLKISAKNVEGILEFGDSSILRAGEEVLAIGNPLGLEFSRTVTQGIVSANDRTITVNTSAGEWALDVIQTDAAINPGNSGGALLNANGQVIGINSLKISESGVEGLGFAIPSNDVIPIVNQLIQNGQIKRPYLGVSLAGLNELPQMYLQEIPETLTKGAMIMQLDPSSGASKAGLKVGDVITSIDDVEVTNSTDLRKYLYNDLAVGDVVTLKVFSEGKEKSVKITLSSQQATS